MQKLFHVFSKPRVKYACLLILLLTIYVYISAISYVSAISLDLQNSLFRLHVIAASDSKEDQDLKYIVRDELIKYMNVLAKDVKSKEDVILLAKSHQEDFLKIAQETITQNGYDYDVTVEIGNFSFPTKTYGDISLPARFL